MPFRESLYWVMGVLVVTLGCQPNIGDSCQLHSDCSQAGDRICDPTFPGGYCTIFNCEPGTCPAGSSCVAYYTSPAEKVVCADPTARRLERTFCMENCTTSSDCRSGYSCVDFSQPDNSVSAVVVERGAYNPWVCTVPPPPEDTTGSGAVCSPPQDASFPVPPVGDGGGVVDAGREAGAARDGAARDGAARDGAARDGAATDGAPLDAGGHP